MEGDRRWRVVIYIETSKPDENRVSMKTMHNAIQDNRVHRLCQAITSLLRDKDMEDPAAILNTINVWD